MEVKKIGSFIAEQRREKQMTQKQLGEALGISDKTVSKWECGYGLPDISMILPLCTLLETNVNELLSGERLAQEAYHEKAEENMMHLIQQTKKTKKQTFFQSVIGTLFFLTAAALLTSIDSPPYSTYVLDMLMPNWYIISKVLLIPAVCLWISGYLRDFGRAFLLLFGKKAHPHQIKYSIHALSIAQRMMLGSGVLFFLFALIPMIFEVAAVAADPQYLEPLYLFIANLSGIISSIFYGLAGAMILEPVKCRLEKLDFMQES